MSSCTKLHLLNLPLDKCQVLKPIQFNSSKLLHGHNQTENLVIIMKDYEK